MMMKKKLFAGLSLIVLSACSTIIEGPHQNLTINTNPSGAKCDLYRKETKDGQEKVVATVKETPGNAYIEKTKYDLKVLCDKDGYQEATYLNHSGTAGATWGNIAAGGLIGWGIDSATGSDNKYETPMNITLVPEESKTASKNSAVKVDVSGETDDKSNEADKTKVADVATVLAK